MRVLRWLRAAGRWIGRQFDFGSVRIEFTPQNETPTPAATDPREVLAELRRCRKNGSAAALSRESVRQLVELFDAIDDDNLELHRELIRRGIRKADEL